MDMDALRRLVGWQPLPTLTWQGIAGVIEPMYKSIQTMLVDDAEHVAHILSDLDPLDSDNVSDGDDNHEVRGWPFSSTCTTQSTSVMTKNPGDERVAMSVQLRTQPILLDGANVNDIEGVRLQKRPGRKRRRSSMSVRSHYSSIHSSILLICCLPRN
jgi:hypothetical protein